MTSIQDQIASLAFRLGAVEAKLEEMGAASHVKPASTDESKAPDSVAWPLYQANAFVRRGRGLSGNPAGVCLVPPEAERPVPGPVPDAVFQAIAAEVNLSETAFLEPLSRDGDGKVTPKTASRFRLRWFSPMNEVPLCGHGTMGAAGTLFYAVGNVSPKLYFETLSGELVCERTADGGVMMKFPRNLSAPATFTGAEAEAHSAIQKAVLGNLADRIATVLYAPSTMKILLVLDSSSTKADLESVSPDTKAMLAVDQSVFGERVVRGVSVCLKDFNPWYGIDEDPVNGATHTTLTPYWAGVLGKRDLVALMCSPRSGRLVLSDHEDDNCVMMGGDVFCSRAGRFNIPMSLFKPSP